MSEQLSKIYYQPEHLWKGRKAIKKLKELTGLRDKVIKQWIAAQALWQVYLRILEKIDHPHYYVTQVNKFHQADLLYLPHDKVYQNTYKYTLNVIDIASGYATRPLKSRKEKEVTEMLADVYKKGPLKYPENFNKTLAQRLFQIQDAQEWNDPSKDSKTWIKRFYQIVSSINNIKNKRTDMKPNQVIEFREVQLKIRSHSRENVLSSDGLYRYLYQPGEFEDDSKRRATDMILSWNTFRLDRIVQDPGLRVLYYLAGDKAPRRAFVSEEIMPIPEDTQLSPDWVKEW